MVDSISNISNANMQGNSVPALPAEQIQTSSKESIFTQNDKKAWIKEHSAEYGSKKAALKSFNEQFEKLDKMPRKEAKAWVKNYMTEHPEASKKDARAAFKEEFGYSVPLNGFQKMLRSVLVEATPVVLFADGLTDGKLGVKKFINGSGNNEAVYVAKDE